MAQFEFKDALYFQSMEQSKDGDNHFIIPFTMSEETKKLLTISDQGRGIVWNRIRDALITQNYGLIQVKWDARVVVVRKASYV